MSVPLYTRELTNALRHAIQKRHGVEVDYSDIAAQVEEMGEAIIQSYDPAVDRGDEEEEIDISEPAKVAGKAKGKAGSGK